MSERIYKYFPSNVLDLVFAKEGYCGIKCSLPTDYNDPFELFLGIDLDVGPEELATYRELVYELPQFPTTCFSLSPVVAPMWAHYAQNHSGFVIEFDRKAIKDTFDDIAIQNVIYRDKPDESISVSLARAAVTKKPRHAVWLRQAVVHYAYFSKYTTWSYEQECRVFDHGKNVEEINGNRILYLPLECISALIVGKNFPESDIQKSKGLADACQIDWFQTCIGKSLPMPFLRDGNGDAFIFDGRSIIEADPVCYECKEPFDAENDLCPWCSITEEHEYEAAAGNPFRLLEQTGGLDDYFETLRSIQSKIKKP